MNDEHDRLRTLLHDAVDDVHPAPDGLDRIRARSGSVGHARRRGAALAVAVAAAVVLATGGTALVAQHLKDGPDARPTPAASSSAGPTRADDVTVYYAAQTASGVRLFSERHHVTGVTGSELEVALQEAASGPPHDADYYPFPAGDGVVVSAEQGSDAITVDLQRWSQPEDAGSGEDQQMALQALVLTADAATGTRLPVRFLVGGRPADGVLSTDTTRPVEPMSADSALATVSIASPAEGAHVGRTFTVTGQAATFEANVVWELKQDGRVVQHGFTTAAECCTQSPYSFQVSAAPGDYTLSVHDTDESDGEGVGTSEDTKQITVQ